MNTFSVISNIAAKAPQKLLLSINDEDITGEAFISETKILSEALLEIGVAVGQRVAMILPNCALWYKLYWSIVKIGAVPVPLDPQVGEWEMERLLSLIEVELCFVASKYRANLIAEHAINVKSKVPSLKQLIICDEHSTHPCLMSLPAFRQLASRRLAVFDFIYEPQQEDRLMLACTSGSTGNPKIISVPHLGFYQSQLDMGKYLGFDVSDIMLLGMPLYHQGGFGMGLQMVLCGGAVLYQTSFDPEKFLEMIEQRKVTAIQLTATLAKILLSVQNFDSYDISSLRLVYFAGEVLPFEIAQEFFVKRNIRLINVIGSSETATMCVWDSAFDGECDVNDFRALSFTKLMVLNENMMPVQENEVGAIFVNTDALILDYYRNELETEQKIIQIDQIKWFNTGDLARKLSNGRIRFAGRAKRIIKRGSNLIYPEELESFLLTHPDIKSVAITSEKHELIGETVIAFVVAREGCRITRGDIVRFCKGKLAAYKIPDQVIETDEIPHDIGKVQYKYLKL